MAAVQNPPSSPTQSRKKSIVVTDVPKFDLELYTQNYSGRTRYERLLLIGTTSTFLCIDALKAAVKETLSGKDTKRYLEAQTLLFNSVSGSEEPEAQRNGEWITQQDKQNAAQTGRLEGQLKDYKNNLVKESIRMGNEELGRHYQEIGEPQKAFEAFSRMRADVSTQKQIIDTSLHLIEVAIEQRNWLAVATNILKIRQIQNGASASTPEDEKALQPYLCAADGLAHMDAGEFYNAALSFLQTESGMGSSCNVFISANDVAVYGGLCALASMERGELTKKILENSNFRTYLELEPNIRRAITFFVNSRYTQCLNILESYRTDYLLDIHLQKHVDQLLHLVRSKSIVQYFIPFSCVTLDSLNQAFAAPGKTIDKELVQMIQRGDLNARIDTQNRLLTSIPTSSRGALHAEALATAKGYEREARRRIQQMNIVAADLELKGNKNRNFGGIEDFLSDSMSAGGREMRSGRGF